jgi:dolichyl-phosphooligosaccharide-protein glycotransferase
MEAKPRSKGMMPRMRWLAPVLLVALGVGARLLPWAQVFRADGSVNLLPADSHYYARFAHLQREAFPRWLDEDPYVNFPSGARILWPPLHTWSVAAAEVVAGAQGDEAGVAWVGPAWSLLWLGVLAWALRRRPWWEAGATLLVLALSPIAVQAGALGNGDHHVHEVFGAALGALLLLALLEAPSTRLAVLGGVVLGGARLVTTLGVLAAPLAALALVVALLAGVNPGARRLAVLGLTASGLSLAAALGFGRWTLDFEALGLFGPLCALAALSAPVALAGALERSRWRWAGLATLGAGALVLPQLVRAATQLGGQDPVLDQVYESHPAWHPDVGLVPLLHSLLFLGPLVLAALALGARRRPALWAPLSVLVALTGLGLVQLRFLQAAAGVLALALGPALEATAQLSVPARRLARGVAGLLVLAPLGALEREPPHETLATRSRPTLAWLRAQTPSPGPPFDVASPPRYGVLAGALLGHFIELWAQRPAVASTFSQASWHLEGNARAWALLGSEDDEAAWREARRLRLAYVVLMPEQQVPGVAPARWPRTLARRLYDGDGSERFPLRHASGELDSSGRPQLKVFGVSAPPGE